MEKQLGMFEGAVTIIEKGREKFPHVSDRELTTRKDIVFGLKQRWLTAKTTVNSRKVQGKIDADRRAVCSVVWHVLKVCRASDFVSRHLLLERSGIKARSRPVLRLQTQSLLPTSNRRRCSLDKNGWGICWLLWLVSNWIYGVLTHKIARRMWS